MAKIPVDPSFPSNKLEELLGAAFENPEMQDEFFAELMSAEVYLLTDNAQSPQGKVPANDDDVEVSIMSSVMEDGTPFIPVFTSLEELQHSMDDEDDHSYMTINGRDLLELVDGTDIVIDPAHQYGLHLNPEETKGILESFEV